MRRFTTWQSISDAGIIDDPPDRPKNSGPDAPYTISRAPIKNAIVKNGGKHMYPAAHAKTRPNQPALIIAGSGEILTYAELEARTNRLAHLLRAKGLRRLDHYAIFMENNLRYVEACGAGERAGLYYTCVNSFLTADELAYILINSESKILITSQAKRDVALAAAQQCPDRTLTVPCSKWG
jgi:acyl-CoA synthetase (AMP-forming)/AMP-acid ligase II